MTDEVTVAIVSGGFALLVAVLGIGGAIAAQVVATRRAFGNSLALFERQAAEAQRARADAVRAENRHRFAEQRRSTYGRALRLADELVATREEERTVGKYAERTMRTIDKVGDETGSFARAAEDYAAAAEANRERAQRLDGELAEAVVELHLLADDPVRRAVDGLRRQARTATHTGDAAYVESREAFLTAAREDLDIETG